MESVMVESKSYLQVEIDGVQYPALLDSGCDLTVVPFELTAGKEMDKTKRKLYGVGGHPDTCDGLSSVQDEGRLYGDGVRGARVKAST